MKIRLMVSFFCAAVLVAVAEQIQWQAIWTAEDAVEFDTVRIGRTASNASPLDNGLYIGYSGAQALDTIVGPFGLDNSQRGVIDIADFGSHSESYYYMELLAGDDLVAYSGLTDYAAMSLYAGDNPEQRWRVNSFSAIPDTPQIPEPSSGLLFLLGGALLGLRRKKYLGV